MKAKKAVKKRKYVRKAPQLHVAIVTSGELYSRRHHGDWASFIDTDKDNAIQRAFEARQAWQANGYGPYKVYVGLILEAAEPKREVILTKLPVSAKTESH